MVKESKLALKAPIFLSAFYLFSDVLTIFNILKPTIADTLNDNVATTAIFACTDNETGILRDSL